jgi:hypothetical protein
MINKEIQNKRCGLIIIQDEIFVETHVSGAIPVENSSMSTTSGLPEND